MDTPRVSAVYPVNRVINYVRNPNTDSKSGNKKNKKEFEDTLKQKKSDSGENAENKK